MVGAELGNGALPEVPADESGPSLRLGRLEARRFDALYRDHFDFVFRNLRRMGVADAQLDDAVQDTFIVALRHMHKYRAESYGRAWLFAIALRVARNYRRTYRRKASNLVPLREAAQRDPVRTDDPFDSAAKAQAVQVLRAFLDAVDDDKRNVFVMTELEQMSAREIAEALQVNLNTVYARIRAARREFARTVAAKAPEWKGDGR